MLASLRAETAGNWGYLYFRWALAQFVGQNGTRSWKQYHHQQEASVTSDLGLN